MSLATIGLLLIAVAWIIQLVMSWKGNKAVRPAFIICYMIGVAAMVTADYLQTNVLSYFEFLTFLAAGILLIRILTAKDKV
ncbi:MAG: hypothetical protein HQ594_04940 [Candidatus Omnitrophica bacterium]|nr:hypothetical protein [Candidatus Omnitrophota bacterium]